jgi:hypothetical protein
LAYVDLPTDAHVFLSFLENNVIHIVQCCMKYKMTEKLYSTH